MRFREAHAVLDGGGVVRDRVVGTLLLLRDEAELEMRLGVAGFLLDGEVELALSVPDLPAIEVDVSAAVVRLREHAAGDA